MRRGVLGLASLAAMFAGIGSAAQKAAASVAELKDALGEPDPHGRRRRGSKGKGKKGRNLHRGGPTFDYLRRQNTKRRWLAGFPIPDEDRIALEAAQAERERKNAKRAFMFRRQEEGKLLGAECSAYYARLRNYEITRAIHTRPDPDGARRKAMDFCGWEYIKALMAAWDAKAPLAHVERPMLRMSSEA